MTDENPNENKQETPTTDPEATSTPAEDLNEPFGDGKKALIVEDDPATVTLIRKLLVDRLFEVSEAKDGKDAWDKITPENTPDIIISDFLMPEMDGFQLLKGLKAEESTADIPIIFISARKNMEDSLLVLGAEEFFSKPLDTTELLRTVKKCLLRSPKKKSESAEEEKPAEEKTEEKKD